MNVPSARGPDDGPSRAQTQTRECRANDAAFTLLDNAIRTLAKATETIPLTPAKPRRRQAETAKLGTLTT